jgi:branched-chain amino acid transport system permease protein
VSRAIAAAELPLQARSEPEPAGPPPGGPLSDRPALSLHKRPAGKAAVAAVLLGIAFVVASHVLPAGVPGGIVLRGVVIGSLNGLLAMGLVLVYRANAIINFAQGELGAFAATLSYELITQSHQPYLLAVPLSVAAAVALSALLEYAVLRRFARASRLIAAVITIGLAQLLLFLQLVIPVLFERYTSSPGAGRLAFPSPFRDPAFRVSGVIFSQDELIAILVVLLVVAGLVLFFQRSWVGIGIRGAAQNGDRAGLLGIPVARLGTITWMLAGGLSALAAILRAPITGYFPGDLAGAALLARALAAAAIGRFENLWVTFAAAVGIATVEQLYTYNFSRAAPLDGIVLVIVLLALLLRPIKTARAGWGDSSTWQSVKEVRPIPAVLRALPEVRRGLVVAGVALIVLLAAMPALLDTSHLRLASVVWIFAIVAVSLVVLTGWSGQVSLGQWAIVGVGGFTTGRLATTHSGLGFIGILIVSGLAATLVSLLLGLPALRQIGLSYGVTTLAFAVAAGGWLFTLPQVQAAGSIPRPELFGRFELGTEQRFYYAVMVISLVLLVAAANLRRSRIGRLLLATRDNPRAVSCFGVRTNVTRLMAFGISGFLAGVAGSLYVFLVETATVDDFKADRSILVFGLAVIGGLGSVAGAVFGALYVLGAQYFLPTYGSFLATGLGVIMFLLAFPGGLGQLLYAARDKVLVRIAARRGIVVSTLTEDRRAETVDEIADEAVLVGAAGER